MFTGIIQRQSKIEIMKKTSTDMTIKVDLSVLDTKIKLGDSIAMDGVCLTVSNLDGLVAQFDLMNETLKRTIFGDIEDGYKVNLEPALTINDKLDGHIVYGDVDSVGTIKSIESVGDSKIYRFTYPVEYAMYLIDKGRITINGASLTTIDTDIKDGEFSVSLIPHSLKLINLADKKVGDKVNLEYDTYAKIIYKQRRFND